MAENIGRAECDIVTGGTVLLPGRLFVSGYLTEASGMPFNRYRCQEDSGRPLTEDIRRRNGARVQTGRKKGLESGLQLQRGLSNADWELEERATKKSW